MAGKIGSRKLWVWLSWSVLVIISIIITHTTEPTLISWYGIVSSLYIGGNVAQKFIEKTKP